MVIQNHSTNCCLVFHFKAFDIAEKELGIAPTMSGYELVNRDSVDKATMVDYLSQFYEIFRKELTEIESCMYLESYSSFNIIYKSELYCFAYMQ